MITVQNKLPGAIRAAIKAAAAQAFNIFGGFWSQPSVFIPAGNYLETPGALTPDILYPYGVKIFGEGEATNITINDPTGTPLLDGLANPLQRSIVEGIRFTGATGRELAMRFGGPSCTGMCVRDCSFYNMNGIQFAGSAQGSETTLERLAFWLATPGAPAQTGILLNNPQSVNHGWRDLSFGTGNSGIGIDIQGGGCIHIDGYTSATLWGGTFIRAGVVGGVNATLGQNNQGVWIKGLRTELPSSGAGAVIASSGGFPLDFAESNFCVQEQGPSPKFVGTGITLDPSCVGRDVVGGTPA